MIFKEIFQITEHHKTARKFLLIFQVCFVSSMVLGGLFSEDWFEAMFSITSTVPSVVIVVRLVYIVNHNQEICAFISELGVHSVVDNQANEKVRKIMKFSLIFCSVTCVTCVIMTIVNLPIFGSEKYLPLNIWFPLDWKNNAIAFWFAYASVVFGIVIGGIGVSFNAVIWYLMLNCGIKYEILGSQFRNMFSPKPTTKKRKISKENQEKLFLQEFIGLLKDHRIIRETIDRFKFRFGNLFFAQITTSAVGICSSVYGISAASHTTYHENIFVIYIGSLFYNFFDIFIIMYLGNEIKLSSDRLSYCLFECNWLERSDSCKKCIIILTEHLKQPHELVIGKLYPLNMETFLSIVNRAYSMFNILQNMI